VIAFVTRWSSRVWQENRVRLNTVSPGPVETPILGEFEQSMGEEFLDGVRDLLGRHATTADIAPVIEAVSGPDFGWMVGQDVQVDAGFAAALMSGAIALPAGSSIWTGDPQRGADLAHEIQAGTTWINSHLIMTPQQPFGGVKWSGIGVENGLQGPHEFTDVHVIYQARS
jgi:Aldehyde dehydrogenase family/Enoyl-(Acyl carrier protein) reductase